MEDTRKVKQRARKTVALAAQVSEGFAEEFRVIQTHRGDQFVSDTVRAALDDFRLRHWRERLPAEEVA